MQKLKIGVLGVSNHLIKRIILPLRNTTNCEIYAIASRSEEKAKQAAEQYNIPVSYADYEALIKDPNVDAIYIPLPNHMHSEWIKKCADYNKPVLCEKPITLDSAEAQEALDYAEGKGVGVMEAFMYKFHPLWQYAKDIIDTNQIGAIQYINSLFSYNNPSSTNIRNVKEYGGGAIYDIGCYAISVPRFLLNSEPLRVVSSMKFNQETGTDTLSSAILDFGTSNVTFTVCTLSETNQHVEIVGSAGRISIPIPFNTYVDTPSEIIITTGQGRRAVTFDTTDQYGLMFEAFANAVLNKTDMPVKNNDATNNMKVIDGLFKSSEINQWVNID